MSDLPHFPVLRGGREYKSLDSVELKSAAGGEPVATVSQANAGIIRRDMRKAKQRAEVLRAVPMAELLAACQRAEKIFLEDTLPIGEGFTQTPDEYVASLSSTSGLPHTLCRANMQKCASMMREMPTILRGLMRGMDPAVLDAGVGAHGDVPVWYTRAADALGAVLPSNSPGVHSLWIPSLALKVPVVLKPGREEPWTPMRIARALMAAGVPGEAFSLYPTDHEGAATVLETCGRALLFGDARTTAPYANNPAIEIHGPGRSKVLLGADVVADWREYLDVLVDSVSRNGGRSCINASAIFVPSHGEEIARGLAERLADLRPRAADDPDAGLAAFANPAFAEMMDAAVTAGIDGGGARDVTAEVRGDAERHVTLDGSHYLLPTVVHCASKEHPLANTEYMFPFTSVVEVPQDEMLGAIGPTLVLTAITRDEDWIRELTACPDVHRLNLGPVSTMRVEWDQPHEGNLFELLYTRRAFQRAEAW